MADVYRALARALGMRYLEGPVLVDPLARFPKAVLTGTAPLAESAGASFAYAPHGRHFARLAVAGPGRLNGIAICTPERLRQGVFAARPDAIAVH